MHDRLRTPRKTGPAPRPAPELGRGFLQATRDQWEAWFAAGVEDHQVPALRRHIQFVDDLNRAVTPDEREKRGRAERLSAKRLGLDRPPPPEPPPEIPPGEYRRPRRDPRDSLEVSLMTPAHDGVPTLGPQICAWIERCLVHGRGNVHGKPAVLDPEKQAIAARMYELDPVTGRRRFQRAALSFRKGWAKSEFACWLIAAEMHPEAPCRFDHWAKRGEVSSWGYKFGRGEPVGVGVVDPLVFMVATTFSQSEQVAFATLRAVLLESPIRHDFDIGEDRIRRVGGTGEARAITTSANPADGRLPSLVYLDETHRLTRHERLYNALLSNLGKRPEAWALETSTVGAPGEESIAEKTLEYAQAVAAGEIKDPSLLFVHRQAAQTRKLETDEQLREALLEASGPEMARWCDLAGAIALWKDPGHDRNYFKRVQLNMPGVHSSDRVFNFQLTLQAFTPIKNLEITVGFDGSYNNDSTFLVAQSLRTGNQWVLGAWIRPDNPEPGWMVDQAEVDEQLKAAFHHFKVIRVFCDQFFCPNLPAWQGRYNVNGKRVVFGIETGKVNGAELLQAFLTRLRAGEVKLANDKRLLAAFAAAHRKELPSTNSEGEPRYLMAKAKHGEKIDAAVAAMLASAAAEHAVRAGETRHFGSRPGRTTVHFG